MYIITSYQDSGVIEICPNGPTKSERLLYLSFWAEVYISLSLYNPLTTSVHALQPLAAGGYSHMHTPGQ